METSLAVGNRVSTATGNGFVRFIGSTAFAAGKWVGVELDTPTGKHNGTVQGKSYFTCKPGHGVFVRPTAAKIIDVPSRRSIDESIRGERKVSSLQTSPRSRSPTTSGVRSTSTGSRAESPFKTPGLPASRLNVPPNTYGASRRQSSPTPSPQTTPRPVAAHRASLSPATSLAGTPSFPKLDPLRLRRSMAGLSPTRQTPVPQTPEKSPEKSPERSPVRSPIRSPEKSLLGFSPAKSTIDDSQEKHSPPSFRRRLLSSESPDKRKDPLPANQPNSRGLAGTSREIEELTAKLRILETKRIEDRRRIREYEANKEAAGDFEKHKEKLQAKMSAMQEEIKSLKSILKNTEAQLQELQRSAAENSEVLEMATLDREMAEERCEVLQLELDSLKERQEELVAENEYLKSENEEFIRGAGVGEGGERTSGSLQLERQNERLKDALVRLRDITGTRESELKSEIAALTEEIEQLTAIKERFDEVSQQLAQSEALIEDLKQQLDTALSAEDLLEELTERNLSLTERIDEMRTTIEDLEALRELNDELEENHLAQERELREEVEMKDALIREQNKRIQTAEETNLDYESTIMRFRELVLSLQSDVESLRQERQTSEAEAKNLSSRSREMLDLNLKLQATSTKSLAKVIDFELRKEHAVEADEQLSIVKSYLPDSFESEKSSIQGLLRFKRLSFKARILRTFLVEQHMASADPKSKPASFDADHAIARTLLLEQLVQVQSVTATFAQYFSKCESKEFEGASAIFHELDPVERNLDKWLTNLRSGEMNEIACSENMHGSLAMLAHLVEIFIKDPVRVVPFTLRGIVSGIEVSLDSVPALGGVLRVQMPQEVDVEDGLIYDVLRKSEGLTQAAMSVKVLVGKLGRGVDEMRSRGLSVELRHVNSFEVCRQDVKTVTECYRKVISELSKVPLYSASIDSKILQTCLDTLAEEYKDFRPDIFDGLTKKVTGLATTIGTFIQLVNDFEKTIELDLPTEGPWIQRAREIKATKHIDNDLDRKFHLAQSEIKDLILQLKLKEKSLEEANVKIKLLDSRMGNVKKQTDRISLLEKQIAEAKARETQFEEAIENLNGDLRNAEMEVGKWRKAAKDGKVGAPAQNERNEGLRSPRVEETRLAEQVETLQSALRYLRQENTRIQLSGATTSDTWLNEPLFPTLKESRVQAEGACAVLLSDFRKFMTSLQVVDAESVEIGGRGWKSTKATAGYVLRKQQAAYQRLCARKDAILTDIKAS